MIEIYNSKIVKTSLITDIDFILLVFCCCFFAFGGVIDFDQLLAWFFVWFLQIIINK